MSYTLKLIPILASFIYFRTNCHNFSGCGNADIEARREAPLKSKAQAERGSKIPTNSELSNLGPGILKSKHNSDAIEKGQ